MAINFFNPGVPEGIVDAMWEIQTANPSTASERAAALGTDGDEVASLLYGERETLAINAKATAATGTALVIPSVGEVISGYHIDSVTINYSATDWPTLDISCHKHTLGTSHDTAHRTYSIPEAVASTLTGGIGVPAGAAGLTMGSLAGGLTSLSIALTANHVEAAYVGNPPTIPASDNHDGTMTITAEVIGDTAPTVAEGMAYDKTEQSKSAGNSTNDTTSITYIKHLGHD